MLFFFVCQIRSSSSTYLSGIAHKGPHPTPHRPRPYDTTVHIGPVYRRGEGGWDVGWWTLVVARRVLHV